MQHLRLSLSTLPGPYSAPPFNRRLTQRRRPGGPEVVCDRKHATPLSVIPFWRGALGMRGDGDGQDVDW